MSKVSMSTAKPSKKSRFYMPSVTCTTSDVSQIIPINFLPVNKGDKIVTKFSQLSLTQPTAVKTFAAFHLKTFSFFVPARTIWRHFEDFMIASPDASIDITAPSLSLLALWQAVFNLKWHDSEPPNGEHSRLYVELETPTSKVITNFAIGEEIVNGLSNPDFETYDFVVRCGLEITDETPSSVYFGYKLTDRGRMLYKILVGLGYEVPLRVDAWGSNASYKNPLCYRQYDALPFLAMARIFYDYIYPSQYVQQQGFAYLFEEDGIDFGTETHLDKLLDLFFCPMEQDFFNSLWLKPNQVANGTNASSISRTDVHYSGSDVLRGTSSDYSTSISQRDSDTTLTLSAFGLRWLESMSDYVIRNNIGGTRFHEWAKAHFGWVSDDEDSNRSVFLKSWQDILSFDAVTASTGTDSQLLGDRAANGNSRGGGILKFEAKEFGFLVYVHMVVPVTDYYQGEKPWVRLKESNTEYYIPELDATGMKPVPRSQLYSCYERWEDIAKVPPSTLDNGFGFSTWFANDFKRPASTLNGDFRLPSRNKDKGAYHSFRDVLFGRNNLALDAQFLHSDNQYNRIFALHTVDDEGASAFDKIESFFTFDTTKYSNMLSIGDSFPIFNKSGESTSVDYQGTQLK